MRGTGERYCLSCGAEWGPRDYCCPACKRGLYASDIPLAVKAPPARSGKVEGPLAGLLDVPPGEVACFVGPPGVGKTSLAMLTLPTADVISTEMSAGALRRYRLRLGVPPGRFLRPRWAEEERLCQLPAHRMRETSAVVFDSISHFPDDRAAMGALQSFCRSSGARGIAVMHETKDGKAWGAASILFSCWATVRCRFERDRGSAGRIAHVDKNRSGPTGSRPYHLEAA